jgi:hypothetical protein
MDIEDGNRLNTIETRLLTDSKRAAPGGRSLPMSGGYGK